MPAYYYAGIFGKRTNAEIAVKYDFIGVDKCLKVVYNSLNVIVCTFMTINQNGSLLNITKQGVGFNGRSKKSSFNL